MSDSITRLSDLYIYHIDDKGNAVGRTNLATDKFEECSFKNLVAKNMESIKKRDTLELSGKKLLGSDVNGEPVFGDVTDITEIFKNAVPTPEIDPYDPNFHRIIVKTLPSGELAPVPQDYYDWSEPPEYCYSYEDYQNRWANMGVDYEVSCFDITHVSEFNKISLEQYEKGFDGMSDEEIYRAIYEKYQYCYGENFLDALAVSYPMGDLLNDRYHKVIKTFNSEIKVLLGDDNTGEIRKKALYGGKSDAEVLSDIIEKYRENGKITHAAMHKIANEADKCGIGGGLRNALLFTKDFLYGKTIFDDDIGNREKLLNKPVTKDFIKEVERMTVDYAKKGFDYYIAGDMITVLEAIANAL